jgi:transposase
MYTKQEIIIKSYREGKSQRCISRELQISRKTVKKYIEEYETAMVKNASREEAQCSYLSKPPEYKTGTRPKLKFTREIQSAIDQLLELNGQKKRQGLRKQLLKKKDILEELHRQGHDIGYTTVCNYISTKDNKSVSHEAFIRQVYQPGDVCEFDWGEIKLYIGGKQSRLQLAVFTSAYSNYRYAFIYNRQDTLSFMESHVRFFDVIGGVPNQMVYDNMRVAVSRFVGPHEKEPTRALLQLRGHYSFTHRFCNAYRGNEKGHVERSVEYVRRKAFALNDKFTDEQEAQEWLCSVLDKLNGNKQSGTGKTANELFDEEQKVLGTLPPSRLVCSEQVQLRVDKYATISYRTNRYSVADHLVGRFVDVHVLSNKIEVHYQNKCICTHERSYGKQQWVVNIDHYLSTFKKKPGALAKSLALASNAYLKQLYQQHFDNEPRNFIDLLSYCRANNITDEQLEASVTQILSNAKGKPTTEMLCALLGNKPEVKKQGKENDTFKMAKQQLSTLTALIN